MATYPATWQLGTRTVSQGYALYTLGKGFTHVAWAMRKAQVPSFATMGLAGAMLLGVATPAATLAPVATPSRTTRMLRAIGATLKLRK